MITALELETSLELEPMIMTSPLELDSSSELELEEPTSPLELDSSSPPPEPPWPLSPPLLPPLLLELLDLPVLQRRPVHSTSLSELSISSESSLDSTSSSLLAEDLGFAGALGFSWFSSSSSFSLILDSSMPSLNCSMVAESVTSIHLFSKQAK